MIIINIYTSAPALWWWMGNTHTHTQWLKPTCILTALRPAGQRTTISTKNATITASSCYHQAKSQHQKTRHDSINSPKSVVWAVDHSYLLIQPGKCTYVHTWRKLSPRWGGYGLDMLPLLCFWQLSRQAKEMRNAAMDRYEITMKEREREREGGARMRERERWWSNYTNIIISMCYM